MPRTLQAQRRTPLSGREAFDAVTAWRPTGVHLNVSESQYLLTRGKTPRLRNPRDAARGAAV
ncbi:MAG TPA: hypothetical protein VFG86_16715, partial [Chloroflexota bacterium]|nr:hypothetical protein [Chloroflexota bacterium]